MASSSGNTPVHQFHSFAFLFLYRAVRCFSIYEIGRSPNSATHMASLLPDAVPMLPPPRMPTDSTAGPVPPGDVLQTPGYSDLALHCPKVLPQHLFQMTNKIAPCESSLGPVKTKPPGLFHKVVAG